jgi:hypothetical protein
MDKTQLPEHIYIQVRCHLMSNKHVYIIQYINLLDKS